MFTGIVEETGSIRSLRLSGSSGKIAIRAKKVLGGTRIVAGHIYWTGMIEVLRKEENAVWVKIRTTPEILELIVEKGSICIDGISLTVAEVSEKSFQVSVIPHTGEETTLLKKKAGDRVNLDNDIVGKYIKKFLTPSEPAGKCGGLTMELLEEYGI